MDPFRGMYTADEGSGWDTSDPEENRGLSSDEDDIREIEEALLQRIHYAEDCEDDAVFSSGKAEGDGDSVLIQYASDFMVKNVTGTQEAERIDVEDLAKDVKGGSEKESLNSETAERKLESFAGSAESNSEESTNVKKSSIKEKMKLGKVPSNAERRSVTPHKADSDSEQESKYKIINKKFHNVSGNNSDSQIETILISSESSNEDFRSTKEDGRTNKLQGDSIKVVAITARDIDLDVGSDDELESIGETPTSQNPDAAISSSSKPEQLTTKRQWRKSREDPQISDPGQAETSKKVRLRRTSTADRDARTLLDLKKELAESFSRTDRSSGDDTCMSDIMLIESQSEDEALDVHYDSTLSPRTGSNQHLSYERTHSRGRYYQEPDGWPRYKCYNCLEFGHASRDCPKPRQRKVVTCVLCGTQGHSDRQCPDALCYICSMPGHQARECPNKKLRYLTCHRCFVKGHTEQLCPDRWRQYHLTTEPGKIQHYNPGGKNKRLVAVNGKIYCYNCSKEGHFGHECLEEPMDRNAPLILPYVVKYDYVPKRFWRMQLDTPEPAGNTEPPSNSVTNMKLESNVPRTAAKKQGKKAKKKQEQATTSSSAKPEAEAAGTAPPMSTAQQRKAKRKRKQAESVPMEDDDQEKESQAYKKCRQMTEEEFEAREKLGQELSTLPKRERRRIRRRIATQLRKESLNREEVLEDYEETEVYVRKSGHYLRKRNDSVREMYTLDEGAQSLGHSTQPDEGVKKEKKKKKKKPKWTKQQRRVWKQQQEQQQQQQQLLLQDQRVTFQPNLEQFAELERRFQGQQSLDSGPQHATAHAHQGSAEQQQQLSWHANHFYQQVNFGSFDDVTAPPAENNINTIKGKKKRKRPPGVPQVDNSVHDKLYTNFLRRLQRDTSHLSHDAPVPPTSSQPKAMSKRKLKKQLAKEKWKRMREADQQHRTWVKEQQAAGRRYMSDRGFRIEPQQRR